MPSGPDTAAGRPRKAADSPRWCERCQKYGDHHTDRHVEREPDTAVLRCRVHGIPDCSPLLNGCDKVTAPFAAGIPTSDGSYSPQPDDLCAVTGCDYSPLARGWCRRHYDKWRKTGHPCGEPPLLRGGPHKPEFGRPRRQPKGEPTCHR